ncbi:nucleotide-binding protein [Mariniphaga sediminis]|uniref:nucleotide-binding protein n=1 Tax=Mariniphaga sediminis TaxID=1628158 RepID=UPI003566F153
MQIAVASGKGGTGKTTVAVHLYHFIGKHTDKKVVLADCDVEEPNDTLFFPSLQPTGKKTVYQLIPEIDTETCTFCKECVEWCEFSAITVVPNQKFAEVDTSLCHSCGACLIACKHKAIKEKPFPLGTITKYKTGAGKDLLEGRLKVGSAMQTTLIKKLKNEIEQNGAVVILDAPPGTSCPVVETVSDADYIILVAEPTPFGLHDLKITVELLGKLKKPFGIIINKAGLGSDDIYSFLKEKKIELLGEIPFSKEFATCYASGEILKNIPEETEQIYREIIGKVIRPAPGENRTVKKSN